MHTLLGATATGCSTLPAVRVIMLLALFGTSLAYLRANAAEIFRPAAAQAHQLSCIIASSGAFHIQLNTSGHHLHVLFLQTGRRTMVTDRPTPKTGVNTFLIIVVVHNVLFKVYIRRTFYRRKIHATASAGRIPFGEINYFCLSRQTFI